MSKSWKEVNAEKLAHDLAAGHDVERIRAEARETTEAYVIGFRPAELREGAGISQNELARRMGVSQPRISQLEQGDPGQPALDPIRRYIRALGGRMRLVAGFDDRDVTVTTSEPDRSG